jgi:hypothetical protein
MPDSRDFPRHGPRDWSEAFLALPMEAPPADGWAGISRALDARVPRVSSSTGRRERRTSWLIWSASAAVLAVVAWAPLERWMDASKADANLEAARLTATASPARNAENDAGATSKVPADRLARTSPIETGAPVELASTPAIKEVPATSLPAAADAQPKRPERSHVQPVAAARKASFAAAASTPDARPPTLDASSTTDTAVATPVDPLPRLYAESAQLEALVALARDDRVASASGAVLAGELDAHIGLIDAALSQSDLSPAQRSALWQQRVDALRELAGVESTERWLASHGERMDGALVRVD